MPFAVGLGAASLSLVSLSWAVIRARRAQRIAQGLREGLKGANVRLQPGGRLFASGFDGATEVLIEHLDEERGRARTRIAARLPSELRGLSADEPSKRPAGFEPYGPVLTGDAALDEAVRVRGPEAIVGAAMLEAARVHLIGLVRARSGWVRRGWVELELPGIVWDRARLEDNLSAVVRVAQALSFDEGAAVARLARVAQHDGVVGARCAAVRRLAVHFPKDATAQAVVAASLRSEEPRVRLAGAEVFCSKAVGIEVARALVEGDELEPADRARALGLLVHERDGPVHTAELHGLLRSRDPEARKRAAEGLERAAEPSARVGPPGSSAVSAEAWPSPLPARTSPSSSTGVSAPPL